MTRIDKLRDLLESTYAGTGWARTAEQVIDDLLCVADAADAFDGIEVGDERFVSPLDTADTLMRRVNCLNNRIDEVLRDRD